MTSVARPGAPAAVSGPGGTGSSRGMKILPYFVMAGAVLVALGAAVVGGGEYWIIPVLIVPIVAIYAVVDRRMKAREGRGERLAAEPDARNA